MKYFIMHQRPRCVRTRCTSDLFFTYVGDDTIVDLKIFSEDILPFFPSRTPTVHVTYGVLLYYYYKGLSVGIPVVRSN